MSRLPSNSQETFFQNHDQVSSTGNRSINQNPPSVYAKLPKDILSGVDLTQKVLTDDQLTSWRSREDRISWPKIRVEEILENLASFTFNGKELDRLNDLLEAKKLESSINSEIIKEVYEILPSDVKNRYNDSINEELIDFKDKVAVIEKYISDYIGAHRTILSAPEDAHLDNIVQLTNLNKSNLKKLQKSSRIILLLNDLIFNLQTGFNVTDPYYRVRREIGFENLNDDLKKTKTVRVNNLHQRLVGDSSPSFYNSPMWDPVKYFHSHASATAILDPVSRFFLIINKMGNSFSFAAATGKYSDRFPSLTRENTLSDFNGLPHNARVEIKSFRAGDGNLETGVKTFRNDPIYYKPLWNQQPHRDGSVPLHISHLKVQLESTQERGGRVVHDNVYLLESSKLDSEFSFGNLKFSASRPGNSAYNADEIYFKTMIGNHALESDSNKTHPEQNNLSDFKNKINNYLENINEANDQVKALRLHGEDFEFSPKNIAVKILKKYIDLLNAAESEDPKALCALSFFNSCNFKHSARRSLYQMIKFRFLQFSLLESIDGTGVDRITGNLEPNSRPGHVVNNRRPSRTVDYGILSRKFIFSESNLEDQRLNRPSTPASLLNNYNLQWTNLCFTSHGSNQDIEHQMFNSYTSRLDLTSNRFTENDKNSVKNLKDALFSRMRTLEGENPRSGNADDRLDDLAEDGFRRSGTLKNIKFEFEVTQAQGADRRDETFKLEEDVSSALHSLYKFEFLDEIIHNCVDDAKHAYKNFASPAARQMTNTEYSFATVKRAGTIKDFWTSVAFRDPAKSLISGPYANSQDTRDALISAYTGQNAEGLPAASGLVDESIDLITFAAKMCKDIELAVAEKSKEAEVQVAEPTKDQEYRYPSSVGELGISYIGKQCFDGSYMQGSGLVGSEIPASKIISEAKKMRYFEHGSDYSLHNASEPYIAEGRVGANSGFTMEGSSVDHGYTKTFEAPVVFLTELICSLGEMLNIKTGYSDSQPSVTVKPNRQDLKRELATHGGIVALRNRETDSLFLQANRSSTPPAWDRPYSEMAEILMSDLTAGSPDQLSDRYRREISPIDARRRMLDDIRATFQLAGDGDTGQLNPNVIYRNPRVPSDRHDTRLTNAQHGGFFNRSIAGALDTRRGASDRDTNELQRNLPARIRRGFEAASISDLVNEDFKAYIGTEVDLIYRKAEVVNLNIFLTSVVNSLEAGDISRSFRPNGELKGAVSSNVSSRTEVERPFSPNDNINSFSKSGTPRQWRVNLENLLKDSEAVRLSEAIKKEVEDYSIAAEKFYQLANQFNLSNDEVQENSIKKILEDPDYLGIINNCSTSTIKNIRSKLNSVENIVNGASQTETTPAEFHLMKTFLVSEKNKISNLKTRASVPENNYSLNSLGRSFFVSSVKSSKFFDFMIQSGENSGLMGANLTSYSIETLVDPSFIIKSGRIPGLEDKLEEVVDVASPFVETSQFSIPLEISISNIDLINSYNSYRGKKISLAINSEDSSTFPEADVGKTVFPAGINEQFTIDFEDFIKNFLKVSDSSGASFSYNELLESKGIDPNSTTTQAYSLIKSLLDDHLIKLIILNCYGLNFSYEGSVTNIKKRSRKIIPIIEATLNLIGSTAKVEDWEKMFLADGEFITLKSYESIANLLKPTTLQIEGVDTYVPAKISPEDLETILVIWSSKYSYSGLIKKMVSTSDVDNLIFCNTVKSKISIEKEKVEELDIAVQMPHLVNQGGNANMQQAVESIKNQLLGQVNKVGITRFYTKGNLERVFR